MSTANEIILLQIRQILAVQADNCPLPSPAQSPPRTIPVLYLPPYISPSRSLVKSTELTDSILPNLQGLPGTMGPFDMETCEKMNCRALLSPPLCMALI